VARERVASTLLASTAVRHGDQLCARVTARRQPGSGKVVWIVVLNEAAGISNPAIRTEVAAAIAALQADTGIPVAETGDLAWLSLAARLPVAMPGGHAEGEPGCAPVCSITDAGWRCDLGRLILAWGGQ
jgi:hypothetical protein